MTRPAADRVKVVWSGTGTGAMTLGAAVAGFQGFPAALNGLVLSYSIEHQTQAEDESGYGTYNSGTNSLTRTFRTYPTFGGAAIDFSSGTKHVRLVALATEVVPDFRTTNPTSNDDITQGFLKGRSKILNTSTNSLFICTSDTVGGAVWKEVGGAGGGGGGTITGAANTATNGVGVFDSLAGTILNYRGIATTTPGGLSVTLDDTQNDIDLAILYASQAEAQIGSENTRVMTPLRTFQQIDALALRPVDIVSAGILTPRPFSISFAGGSIGDVLTVQNDNTIGFLPSTAGTVIVDKFDIVGRLADGSGNATGISDGDLTEDVTGTGFALAWVGGALRKINVATLGGGGSAVYTAASGLNLSAAVFTTAPGVIYNPITISANTTIALGAGSHLNGAEIITILTISGAPTLTWASQFVFETDGQNGSLPTTLPAGTYFLRMQYTVNQLGTVRVGVVIINPLAPPPPHTHTIADITDLGAIGGSPVGITADVTLGDTHFNAGSIEATHATTSHIVSIPNGRTAGSRLDILVPNGKAPLRVRRVSGNANFMGGPAPGYYTVPSGGRAHVRISSTQDPYLLGDLILGGSPPASPHTQLLRGTGVTLVGAAKVASWASSPSGAAWTQTLDANRPTMENGSVRFITIGGVNQHLTKTWVDEISTNQLLIAISFTVDLASITGSNPSIISLYNFSSSTAVNRGVRVNIGSTGIMDMQTVNSTAADTSPATVTGITIKSLVPQTVVWWVDRTNSPSTSLLASDTEGTVIGDKWNEISHTQPVVWNTSLNTIAIGGQESDRPISMLVHGVMIKQDAGPMSYFGLQDVLAQMRRLYPPQFSTLNPG